MKPVGVFGALVGLTLVEVALAWVHAAPALMLGVLLVLSLAKAGLIAWYFMHLQTHRPKGLGPFFPMLAACIGLLLVLLADGLRTWSMR